ncbi:MAG: hypothetical protein A2Z14_08710 [Chloroflexi bacterium RBG_16_48_8]|nr:MAG: hypothetical protein A2Z14_08710 [Chloroflexi bacterium RBG_16_48_8]
MSDIKKRFSRRDFLRVTGSAAATLPLLAACAEATEEATQAPGTGTELEAGERGGLWLAPEPPELKKIVTATNTPSYFTVLPWYTMIDYGFTAEEGFEEVEFIIADAAFDGVISKDFTIGCNMEPDEVMVAQNEGVPLVAIAVHRDHEWQIAGMSPTIKKPEDLIGGTAILGSPGSRTFLQYRDHILKWSGGTVDIERDMEFIELSGGSDIRQQALIADQIQIANIYTRHLMGLKEAGASWAVFAWNEWAQEFIVAHADTVAEAPRTIVNLLRAYLKSINVLRNWNEKAQLVKNMAELHEQELTAEFDLAYVSQMDQIPVDAGFRPTAMKFFLDDLASYDIIPKTNYDQVFDLSFLQQAQTELFGLAWPPTKTNDFFTAANLPLVVELK